MAEGGVSPRTVPAEAFGTFLCAIFDEWVRQDIGRIIVQMFGGGAPATDKTIRCVFFGPLRGCSGHRTQRGLLFVRSLCHPRA